MNLEDNIKDCITKELEKGIIESVITKKLERCIEESINDLFTWHGAVKKAIEEKLKETMVPYLENYDYSQYVAKLDNVLIDILNHTALDNKKILDNFKTLMSNDDIPEEIKLSDIYDKWCDYCKDTIDKDNIEMDHEGGCINVNMSTENISSDWSGIEKYTVTFECEEDEDLNLEFLITRWKKYNNEFSLVWDNNPDINSLRYMKEFDIFMMKLKQNYTKIILNTTFEHDEIFIEYEE